MVCGYHRACKKKIIDFLTGGVMDLSLPANHAAQGKKERKTENEENNPENQSQEPCPGEGRRPP